MGKERGLKIISAKELHYKELNEQIRKTLEEGYQYIKILEVNGHRYIGDGLTFLEGVLEVYGTPGNDLGVFMNGSTIEVFGNAQDGVGNTMNDGKIIIHGNVGDLMGYGMRGGKIFVKGSAGYRVGIHMKEYENKVPIIVIGGSCGDFLGEYMAGGRIIVLGLNEQNDEIIRYFCGTGMHGGIIYVRGMVPDYKLGREVKVLETDENDMNFLYEQLLDFSYYFNIEIDELMKQVFYKLIPYDKRPYGRLYAY